MSFFNELNAEISNMDIPNFVIVALMFYIPFRFSRKADNLFLHLIYSFFGIYLLFTMDDPRIIYDVKMLVGVGLIIPQIQFLRYFISETIETIKMMSVNTYFFIMTLYYKFLRFINWLNSIYIFLKTFFSNYKKDNSRYEEKEQYYKQEYSYERQRDNNSYNQENYSEEDKETYEEEQKDYGEFARFYSDSAYIVLGVSPSDDYPTIKKAYRMLIKIYHPDKNYDEFDFYNEIMQNINEAHEKLKKIHNV